MDTDELKKKLANLEAQRAKLAAGLTQLDGAIGFCKGLVAEAEKPAAPVNRIAQNGDLHAQIQDAIGGEG